MVREFMSMQHFMTFIVNRTECVKYCGLGRVKFNINGEPHILDLDDFLVLDSARAFKVSELESNDYGSVTNDDD